MKISLTLSLGGAQQWCNKNISQTNIKGAQRCNTKGTHPRLDRTEWPVTDAWSGLSRRIFPGIQLLGWVGIHSPAFSRFWSRPRKHRFSAVPHQHSTTNSNQDKYTTDIHWGRYIFTNGREKILLLVEDVLLIGNSTSLWQAIFCLESGKYKKGGNMCRYDRARSPSV